jgi:predicted transposase/invertase (TIGR01784 family)
MKTLKHKMTNDILFKMLFVKYPNLLKQLVAALLSIPLESITEFAIINPEIPPESLGEKFCQLDIHMTVNEQRVDLEIQVNNEGDYPERSLYYWARDFSSALNESKEYSVLPRTVVISIVNFNLFVDYDGFHSEYQTLEVNRHTPLTDKMSLHYFEITKLPKDVSTKNKLELWLLLFAAKTEEDLAKIEAMEVLEMSQAIDAYRNVVVEPAFKEAERLRFLARHNEAAALSNARRQERDKWQGVVAEQAAEIARLRALVGEGK